MKNDKAITKIVLDTFSQNPSWIEDDNGNIITKQVIRGRATELLIDDELSLLEICLKICSEYDISILLPNGDSIKTAENTVNFDLHLNGGISL